MATIMVGRRNDIPKTISGFKFLYFLRIKKAKQKRKKNSMATGTLNKKVKPKANPDQKIYFSNNKKPKIVGKSIKISALAIWPSITGIEVRMTKSNKATFARFRGK